MACGEPGKDAALGWVNILEVSVGPCPSLNGDDEGNPSQVECSWDTERKQETLLPACLPVN